MRALKNLVMVDGPYEDMCTLGPAPRLVSSSAQEAPAVTFLHKEQTARVS